MQNNNFQQFRIRANFLQVLEQQLNYDEFLQQLPRDYILNLFHEKQINLKLSQIIKHPNEVSFTREEIFVLILLMYCGQIDTNFSQGDGFYVSDMNRIKISPHYKSIQKLRCIQNYFLKYISQREVIWNQTVCFTRSSQPINSDLDPKFETKNIHFIKDRMEKFDKSVVVDFADQNIGGLSLNPFDLAQEEIMMLIYTEALICMLFIPPLQQLDAVLIENLIKYNDYEGYENTFCWKQQNENQINHLLAIDALHFYSLKEQLVDKNIQRELFKCFIGFDLAMRKQKNVTISTGKWGCGIFRGDVYLKTVIQITAFLMAAQMNDSKHSILKISTMNDQDLVDYGNQLNQSLSVFHYQRILAELKNLKIGNHVTHLRDHILEIRKKCLQQSQL